MTPEQMKQWLRSNLMPFWTKIKDFVRGEVNTAKDELRQEFGTITGTFKGGFSTVGDMPTGSGTKTGDWAVLTADDGSNESGIYVKGTGGWSYVADITTFDEVQALLATDSEFQAGTSTTKAVRVRQLTSLFTATISPEEAQADWDNA